MATLRLKIGDRVIINRQDIFSATAAVENFYIVSCTLHISHFTFHMHYLHHPTNCIPVLVEHSLYMAQIIIALHT